MTDLKPCPFCGHTDVGVRDDNIVECVYCAGECFQWNTRPIEDALRATISAYVDMKPYEMGSTIDALRAEVAKLKERVEYEHNLMLVAESAVDTLRAEVAEQRMYAENYGTEVLALRAEIAKYRGMEFENAALRNDSESHCLCRADAYQLENQIEHLTSELGEQARLLGISGSVEARLLAKVDALTAELERWKAPLTVDQIGSVCAIAGFEETPELVTRTSSLDIVFRAVRSAGEKP